MVHVFKVVTLAVLLVSSGVSSAAADPNLRYRCDGPHSFSGVLTLKEASSGIPGLDTTYFGFEAIRDGLNPLSALVMAHVGSAAKQQGSYRVCFLWALSQSEQGGELERSSVSIASEEACSGTIALVGSSISVDANGLRCTFQVEER